MKQFLFALLVMAGSQLQAQYMIQNKNTAGKKKSVLAYGSIAGQYSRFNKQAAVFSGVYGGVLLHHRIMIGAGAYGLVTRHRGVGLNAATQRPNNWKMGYAGLVAEYTVNGNRNIHFTANTLLGGGIIKNGHGRGTHADNGADELKDIDASGFYVVHPSVNIDLIAAKWMRISAGAGYRYIMGSNHPGINDAKMSAPTASLAFKFGMF